MTDETYNGWEGKGNKASAYATWRIMLELVDPEWLREAFPAGEPTVYGLAEHIKEETTSFVCESVNDPNAEHVATQYAMAFLEEVSWMEIAEHILRDWED